MDTKQQFLNALRSLGASKGIEVVTDVAKLSEYASDHSHHEPCVPLVAVVPANAADVTDVVRLCRAHNITITTRGAGSGLEGSCIPLARSCVVDTRLLRSFVIDKDNAYVWVGAGMKKLEVLKRAHQDGFHFGPDPASNPSVGGMCATGGSGMSTLKYGTTRENVLALRVVTPNGELFQTRAPVRKSSTGLDLTQLYCGSEGTLGIIVEVCFKLHPLHPHIAGGYATFETTSAAVASVVAVRKLGSTITSLVRCELLNKEAVDAANRQFRMGLRIAPTVLFEFNDADPKLTTVERDMAIVRDIFHKHHVTAVEFTRDKGKLDDVWEARRGCLMAAGRFRGKRGEKLLNTDVCVPLSALAEVVEATEADFHTNGVPCIICAHIADGNFHCFIPYQTAEEKAIALQVEGRMVERAIKAGGTASGEHGIGIGKVKHMLREHGATHIATQEAIKRALDPVCCLNPGVFYPSEVRLHHPSKL